MTRKQIAAAFLQAAASGNVGEAYNQFIHPDFIHHNQYFAGDRDSLLTAMEEASVTHPNKSITIKQSIEEGNLVMTHSHVVRVGNEPDVAVVHIFRFDGEMIVELWDLGQLIDKNSPNKNGLF